MTFEIVLTREEIAEHLPFPIVCQTRYGAAWDTGKCRRKWGSAFTAEEQEKAETIFRQSHKWYTKGIPEETRMDMKTYRLWRKIAAFCYTF